MSAIPGCQEPGVKSTEPTALVPAGMPPALIWFGGVASPAARPAVGHPAIRRPPGQVVRVSRIFG